MVSMNQLVSCERGMTNRTCTPGGVPALSFTLFNGRGQRWGRCARHGYTRWGDRERHAKDRPAALTGLARQRSAVCFHDLTRDRQPQPGAFALGGEKWVEDARADLVG